MGILMHNWVHSSIIRHLINMCLPLQTAVMDYHATNQMISQLSGMGGRKKEAKRHVREKSNTGQRIRALLRRLHAWAVSRHVPFTALPASTKALCTELRKCNEKDALASVLEGKFPWPVEGAVPYGPPRKLVAVRRLLAEVQRCGEEEVLLSKEVRTAIEYYKLRVRILQDVLALPSDGTPVDAGRRAVFMSHLERNEVMLHRFHQVSSGVLPDAEAGLSMWRMDQLDHA